MAKIKIHVGLKFKSKYYNGITTVTAINEKKNTLSVRINNPNGNFHDQDDWDLKHTIWAFENKDYVVENTRPDIKKNGNQNKKFTINFIKF